MGKLVIKSQGRPVGEVNLKLGDTTIGRAPGSDVVLEDPIVSAQHAVVKTVGMKSTIVDLKSTNGTFVENNRVTQHLLKNGETIIIGGYSLMYRDELNLDTPVFGARPAAGVKPSPTQRETTVVTPFAQMIAVDGKDKGKRVPLVKDVVNIDNPGKSPAKISRIPDGYLMEAQIGPGEPTINGRPVPPGGHILENGDTVDVAGTKYQFAK